MICGVFFEKIFLNYQEVGNTTKRLEPESLWSSAEERELKQLQDKNLITRLSPGRNGMQLGTESKISNDQGYQTDLCVDLLLVLKPYQ